MSDADLEAAEPSDAALSALVLRASTGDPAACLEVYDGTASQVYGLALRMLQDRARAEELTRQVYAAVWDGLVPGKDTSPLAWLLGVTHRAATLSVREMPLESRRERERRAGILQVATEEPDTAPAAPPGPSGTLTRCMTRLTVTQQRALHLAYFGGLTHREVDQTLELTEGTASVRLADGLRGLRDLKAFFERTGLPTPTPVA